MRKLLYTTLLVLTGSFSLNIDVFAQAHESGDPYMMEQINKQMAEQLNDIPVNIRRVSVYKINYSAFRFTSEEVEYIRSEVEYAFRQYAGLTILSPPELEPNDKMKIMGSDSTLKILNVRGRSLADVSPEFLNSITSKYGVQGLVELSIQRRDPEGLVLAIRMMNPDSREVVWGKNFVSNVFKVEEVVDKGKTSMVHFGVGSKTTESIFNPDTSLAVNDSLLTETVIDLHASYTFRQPLDQENSAYIGFSAGIHILSSRNAEEFAMNFLDFGVSYYQAISAKNEDINEYRAMLFINSSIQFPLGSQKGEMFSATPGLLLNLSQNIGLSFYGSFILAGETIKIENNQKVTFNKIGYGVQGVIRF